MNPQIRRAKRRAEEPKKQTGNVKRGMTKRTNGYPSFLPSFSSTRPRFTSRPRLPHRHIPLSHPSIIPLSSLSLPASAAETDPPNVILMLTDDQGIYRSEAPLKPSDTRDKYDSNSRS